MGNFPDVKPKELIKILEKRGFQIARQKGSHVLLNKINGHILRVTVPLHNKSLKRGTLLSILRQAELTKNDLR